MSYPSNLKYTKEHEWVRLEEGNTAYVGITAFAAGELGDIVYVDIDTVGEALQANDVFGTVEAVKTVSDLFLPLNATVLEVNEALADNPELVNTDPYGQGWMIKVSLENSADMDGLMSAEAYKELVG